MDAYPSITLAGSMLTGPRHVCAFFRNKEEMFRVFLPFIVDGLEKREKAIHIVSANNIDLHLGHLAAGGVDVDAVLASGQLQIVEWNESYFHGREFDEGAALRVIDQLLTDAHAQGYSRTRQIGDMDWVLENRLGTENWASFEAQLNDVVLRHPQDVVICAYDLSRFGGSAVLDVMRTHPAAIVGGLLQHNPFYTEPKEMLRELRARGER
jgi:hypothetical protein